MLFNDYPASVQEHVAHETLQRNREDILKSSPSPVPPKKVSFHEVLPQAGGSKERMARDMYVNHQACLSWPNWPSEEGVLRKIRYGI